MSNKDEELLESILRETEGRHAQRPVQQPAEQSREQYGAEPASASEPGGTFSDGTEQVQPAEQSAASAQQQESSQTQTEEPAEQAVSEAEALEPQPEMTGTARQEAAQEAVPEAKPDAQTAQTDQPRTDKKNKAQGAPNKTKPKRKKFSYKDVLRGLFPWKGDSGLEVTRKIVFLISVIAFSVCLELISSYYWGLHQSKKLYDQLQREIEQISLDTVDPTKIQQGSVSETMELSELGERLLAQNADAVGYISIPGTKVNYPIVQRRSDDGNDYYLYRNFNGEHSDAGVLYLDYRNNFDRVENGKRVCDNSTNLVVYGHNMDNLSMFGSLKNYRNDWGYYSKHPLITLCSNYQTYTYKIFGFFIIDAEDESETKFDCWNTLNFSSEEEFYDYVNNVKRRALQTNGVDVQYGDQLLTLFTCSGIFDEARLIVMARMVRPDEDPYAGTQESQQNPNVLWPTIYYRWNKNNYDPDAEFVPYGPVTTTGDDNEPAETTEEADE